jgi:hypothetical protein
MATFAMCGPKYRTNVWRPVPSPTDEATPKIIQYSAKSMKALMLYISVTIYI